MHQKLFPTTTNDETVGNGIDGTRCELSITQASGIASSYVDETMGALLRQD